MCFMSISLSQVRVRALLLEAALLCLVCSARAVQTPAPSPAHPAGRLASATNAAPTQLEVPKSVFHIPNSPQDPARDPFFPQSTRLYSKAAVVTPTNQPAPVVELELKGISGGADRRFAIINSRTFASGEDGDVPVGRGRAHIRVIEVKADSVVVVVNGEQRVLRLRAGL